MIRAAMGILIVLGACESKPRAVPIDRAAPELAGGIGKAQAALDDLQARLQSRLAAELAEGGAVGAVTVCRDEAQTMTAAVARDTGVAVGRTSHRLRNASNVAPAWVHPFVERAAEEPVHEPLAIDLGDRVGVLRPIYVTEPCLRCHGPRDAIEPEVIAVLAAAYPDDSATGFVAGQLRGFAWAEAPK